MDWADTKHDICIQPADGGKRVFECVAHQVSRIDEWAKSMRQRYGTPIAVALELAKSPIVAALQKYGFFVPFPINPSTLAKYRGAFKPSRAKDDPTDAQLALELLLLHPERFAPLKPQSVPMRSLLTLIEQRRELVDDKTRFTNRLGHTLKQYYPQVLEWFDKLDNRIACDFLARWPTLPAARPAHRATLEEFFRSHNCRRSKIIDARVEAIRSAVALTEDPAIVDPCRLHVQVLIEQLRVTLAAIEQFDQQIEAVAQTIPDYPLFRVLPGAGPGLAPRLRAALGEQRERYQGAAAVQMYAGIAPVTERSGKKSWVHWRWQCPTFLRQTFVEWAGQTINNSAWTKVYYYQQRAKGSTYQAAVRTLAYKWIRILYRCWQTRTPYDEAAYLSALKNRGSPLMKKLALQPHSP